MGEQRLELTWIGKNTRPKLEPRILIEDPGKSFGSTETDNTLIHGDNLLALKALEQDYSGKVKCIYIDPPYNTGSAFEHYEDGLEHSIWLSLIRDRLLILKNLLSDNGSIWISIDDNEMAYLKVLLDEIFGRPNFITTICWEMIYTKKNSAKYFSGMHDYILVYAKKRESFVINQLPRGEEQNKNFKNPDNDPRGVWIDSAVHARNFYSKGSYQVTSPGGKQFSPPAGRYWTVSEENFQKMEKDNRIWWGEGRNNAPRKKTFLTEVKQGVVPGTIWNYKEAGHNAEAKNEIKELFKEQGVFITPKPEKLIKRILQIATIPGDLILDSFIGSGTTCAVAHKMGRKWIGIELGEHCYTHCKPRLDQVITGHDQGGVSIAENWKGGGGYKFYELAPSLLNKDAYGNWIINKDYNADMMAAAMAKQEGFNYNPAQDIYWKQGQSTEQDYIFTTTEFLTQEHLEHIHSQMKDGESLLICCKAFNANDSQYSNITIKKIPQMLMGKCEFGKNDYSLNIINIPLVEPMNEKGGV